MIGFSFSASTGECIKVDADRAVSSLKVEFWVVLICFSGKKWLIWKQLKLPSKFKVTYLPQGKLIEAIFKSICINYHIPLSWSIQGIHLLWSKVNGIFQVFKEILEEKIDTVTKENCVKIGRYVRECQLNCLFIVSREMYGSQRHRKSYHV